MESVRLVLDMLLSLLKARTRRVDQRWVDRREGHYGECSV